MTRQAANRLLQPKKAYVKANRLLQPKKAYVKAFLLHEVCMA
jgi:hypothetical protein